MGAHCKTLAELSSIRGLPFLAVGRKDYAHLITQTYLHSQLSKGTIVFQGKSTCHNYLWHQEINRFLLPAKQVLIFNAMGQLPSRLKSLMLKTELLIR